MMTQEAMRKVLQAGISLSSERDLNRLLDIILASVMELANCDAGTLYLLEDDGLHFKIMHTNSLGTHSGGDGKDPDLPPVPLKRENVCAFSLLENRTICIENVHTSKEYDFSGPIRYDAITGYHTESMLVVPMTNREGKKLGVLQLINALDENGNIQIFPEDMILALESVASQASITLQNVQYMQEIKALFNSFVRTMSAAVDERSSYNANHSRRMALFGENFVNFLNNRAIEEGREEPFSPQNKEELITSIWLHDIGKLTTPRAVMDKPKRLTYMQREQFANRMKIIRLLAQNAKLQGSITDEEAESIKRETIEAEEFIDSIDGVGFIPDEKIEWIDSLHNKTYIDENGNEKPWLNDNEYQMLSIRRGTLSPEERKIMENHVVVTDRLLSQIKFSADLSHVRQWASLHHETLNGTGYPHGLKEDEIPKEVRIITIIDIFDALVAEDRPYKPGMPVERALSILETMATKEGKLDPELTELFKESRCWEGISLKGEKVN